MSASKTGKKRPLNDISSFFVRKKNHNEIENEKGGETSQPNCENECATIQSSSHVLVNGAGYDFAVYIGPGKQVRIAHFFIIFLSTIINDI